MKLKFNHFLAVCMTALAFTACSKDESTPTPTPEPTPEPEVIKVTELTVSPVSMSLTVGEKKTLKVTLKPENATDKTVTFTSSDEKVATIDANGTVTAVAPGKAVLTVSANGGMCSATTGVTVKAPKTVADHAFLFYATGDKDLDQAAASYLKDMLKQGSTENARYVVQFNPQKTSITAQPELKHTYRMIIGGHVEISAEYELKGKTLQDSISASAKFLYDVIQEGKTKGGFTFYEESELKKLWEPAVVKDFLDWAATKVPANNYLMCISGHGGGWDPGQDYYKVNAKPAGVSWDYNFRSDEDDSVPMTARELAEGIKSSTIASKVSVYMDACHMNTIEYVSELAQSGAVHYIASCATTRSTMIPQLMSILDTDANPLSAYTKFCDTLAVYGVTDYDVSLWTLSSVKALNAEIKILVDSLCVAYEKDTVWCNKIIRSLKKESWSNYDLTGFVKQIKDGGKDVPEEVKGPAKKVYDMLQSPSTVITKYTDEYEKEYKGLLLNAVVYITGDYYKGGMEQKYLDVIDNSAFTKQTGWNKFLDKLYISL